MITLKKQSMTNRQIAEKINIDQRVINKIYKRVVNRSLKLKMFLNDFSCYEYKITSHAKIVTKKKTKHIVKKIITTTKNRKKSVIQLIKQLNFKNLKIDKYERQMFMSKFCFKQIMYDVEYDHEITN